MDFVLLDETGGAPTASGVPMDAGTLAKIAAAAQVYLNRDVAAHYGGSYRVRAGENAADIQSGESVFVLLADLPNAPGAIADHDVNGVGVPVLYDAVTLSDTLTGPGNSVSVAITHELAETAGDEGCDIWADNGAVEFAHELCDAVEAQSYAIDDTGVYVSNFVIRAFWIPNHAGPFDFLSTLGSNDQAPRAPLTTAPGGYQITRTSGTNEQAVQGKRESLPVTVSVSATIPFGRRLPKKQHWSSRTYRRGARV
jgi:hypothetical protein